jgi:integrase
MNLVEPIRDVEKIKAIKRLLRCQRDVLLFVMGINTALRVSDLLRLTIADVTDPKGHVLDAVVLREKKTGKEKSFPINSSVKKELKTCLEERKNYEPSDPLFPSRKQGGGKPIDRRRAWTILNAAGRLVGLTRIGTHTLRKTFGYHVFHRSGGNLALVQKLLNHSSSGDTLRYIGIDKDQMDAAYLDLNL